MIGSRALTNNLPLALVPISIGSKAVDPRLTIRSSHWLEKIVVGP